MSLIDKETGDRLGKAEANLSPVSSPDRVTLRGFFDSIASRYDFLNHLLSFRLDESWRRRTRDLLLTGREKTLLDLGSGTGKLIGLFEKAQKWDTLVGLDFSLPMLRTAKRHLSNGVGWVRADFHALPFRENTFDLVISAFALRSVKDIPLFLKEVYKILKSNGKAGLLCLTRPKNFLWKTAVYPYLKFYLPLVGGLVSGNRSAYRFLSESILSFQEPAETAQMMEAAGFHGIEIQRFSGGLATLIIGRKG